MVAPSSLDGDDHPCFCEWIGQRKGGVRRALAGGGKEKSDNKEEKGKRDGWKNAYMMKISIRVRGNAIDTSMEMGGG